jgi:hypothetical protein
MASIEVLDAHRKRYIVGGGVGNTDISWECGEEKLECPHQLGLDSQIIGRTLTSKKSPHRDSPLLLKGLGKTGHSEDNYFISSRRT